MFASRFLLCSVLCALTLAPTLAAPAAKPRWYSDGNASLALGRKTGRPVLLNFGAAWCSPCHELDKTVFRSAPFQKESRNWVLAKIDAENGVANLALAKKYGAVNFPALIFVDAKGREVSRLVGYYPNKIVPAMTKARARTVRR